MLELLHSLPWWSDAALVILTLVAWLAIDKLLSRKERKRDNKSKAVHTARRYRCN